MHNVKLFSPCILLLFILSLIPLDLFVADNAFDKGIDSCAGTFAYGKRTVLKIKPDADSRVADVLVNGISIGPAGAVTFSKMTGDHTIQVDFEKGTP